MSHIWTQTVELPITVKFKKKQFLLTYTIYTARKYLNTLSGFHRMKQKPTLQNKMLDSFLNAKQSKDHSKMWRTMWNTDYIFKR